jgi:hypothetical protein
MSCGCGPGPGAVKCRAGSFPPDLVTRTAMCAACPDVDRGDGHRWICTRSLQPVAEHRVGLPCPRNRHPDRHGFVRVSVAGREAITHGVPMGTRIWLVVNGDVTLRGFFRMPGCGCFMRLKRRARQALDLDLWVRWARVVRARRDLTADAAARSLG